MNLKRIILAAAIGLQLATGAGAQTVYSAPYIGDRVIYVDTVADMLALPAGKSLNGQVVITKRYSTSHTVGDGSGNAYRSDTGEGGTPDGGFVINDTGTHWHAVDKSVANVLQFGAVGDGTTACLSEMQAAFDAGGENGVPVYLPPGDFLLDAGKLFVRDDGMRIYGAGMDQTSIVGNTKNVEIGQTGAVRVDDIKISDLTIDSAGTATNCVAFPQGLGGSKVRFERVRFQDWATDGVNITDSVDRISFDDCEWVYTGTPNITSSGVICTATGNLSVGDSISFDNCRFELLANSIFTNTGSTTTNRFEKSLSGLSIHNCNFVGLYWARPAIVSSSSTTFSGTGDTVCTFGDINPSTTITSSPRFIARYMGAGTASTITDTSAVAMQDTGATFTGNKLGDIIRTASKWTTVRYISSNTLVTITGWRDNTTGLRVDPPADSTAYTIYTPVLGQIESVTSSAITVSSWYHLDGSSATAPSDTDEIEIAFMGVYAIQLEHGVRHSNIDGNFFYGQFADNVSSFGNCASITDNHFVHAGDGSITVDGEHNTVTGNIIELGGLAGIYLQSKFDHGTIVGNTIAGFNIVNKANGSDWPGIDCIGGGNGAMIAGNVINANGVAAAVDGVRVRDGCTNHSVVNNTTEDVTTLVNYDNNDASNGCRVIDNNGVVDFITGYVAAEVRLAGDAATATGITASTTQTQGQQPLTAELNIVATCATTNDVVTLPEVCARRTCRIVNNGAETLQIYPASGDDLGAGTNTSTTLTSGSSITFVGIDGTDWEQF